LCECLDKPLNINADTNSAEIAKELHADKLIIMTDTDGILDENGNLFPSLDREQVEEMLKKQTISAGMIPKVKACLAALEGNVKKVHIINGTNAHALAMEIFTESGIGTEIIDCKKIYKMKHA